MAEEKTVSPAQAALVIGNEIKQIVMGSPLEKDAMLLGAMYSSGYFKDVNSLSKAITKALIGQSMGMGLVQSMNSLYVIDGRVAMDSHAIRNTAVMQGYGIKTTKLDKEGCVIEWTRRNKDGSEEVLGTSEFTWDDAKAAGLTEKSNWKKYPKDMLFARAVTRGARQYAGKAFGDQPIYERDELDDHSPLEDVSPTDQRVDRIRNAESLDELGMVIDGLEPEELKAMSGVIADKTKELFGKAKDEEEKANGRTENA